MGINYFFMSFVLLYQGCIGVNTERLDKYYGWAIIKRYDGHSKFSNEKFLNDIKRKNIQNYYKVYYKDRILNEILTYKDGEIFERNFFDKKGFLKKSIDKEGIICNVKYLDSNTTYRYDCNNQTNIIFTYENYELVKIEKFSKKKLKQIKIIEYGHCKELDENYQTIAEYECYPYEETMPLNIKEEEIAIEIVEIKS